MYLFCMEVGRCEEEKKIQATSRIVVNKRGWEWHVFILHVGVMLWREKKDTGY